MDHFARPDDELATAQTNRTLHRNFQGYTTKAGADLYGMGVTAISGFQDAYAQNFRELPAWEKAIGQRGLATMRGYHLSAEDRLRREVISRLLCHTVIPKREINAAFAIDFDKHFATELQRLERAREDGLLTIDRDEIRATWLGRIFIRNLAMLFDPYLEQQQLHANPLFSKTL
jgi:oxygen-independent coproporphyrinogen-3 oxidase